MVLFVLVLCLASGQLSILNGNKLVVGNTFGSFPLDQRTMTAQELFEDRGILNRYQKYWLNSLPAGGQVFALTLLL